MSETIERWRHAGNKYETARAIAAEEAARPKLQPVVLVSNKGPDSRLVQAIGDFDRFLKSDEGKAALYLLDRAQRHIVLYSENDGGGVVAVTYLDGKGLFDGVEAKRSEGHFTMSLKEREQYYKSRDNFKPASPTTAVINAYGRHGYAGAATNGDPSKFMEWLRDEIDKIAAAAPKTASTSAAA
jgi:hypothetical protein